MLQPCQRQIWRGMAYLPIEVSSSRSKVHREWSRERKRPAFSLLRVPTHERQRQGTHTRKMLTIVVSLLVNKSRFLRNSWGDGISRWESMRLRQTRIQRQYPARPEGLAKSCGGETRLHPWDRRLIRIAAATATAPGPYAEGWIPLPGPGRNWTTIQIKANNINGERYGCHTCGGGLPLTLRGNWVIDHQPPVALNPSGLIPYRGYPQCALCGLIRKGGTSQPYEILRILRMLRGR